MKMPLTLYIDTRPLVILEADAEIPAYLKQLEVLPEPDKTGLKAILDDLIAGRKPGIVFRTPAPASLFTKISSGFEVIVAGGGLITNPDGEILLMFRRGKWDMPKGKQDEGESIEACALREVQEETGLSQVSLGAKLLEKFHYYPWKDKKVSKHSVWYRMEFTGTELTVPQIEEDIMDIQWIRPEHIARYMAYSYPNIRDVVRAAGYETGI